MHAASQAAPTLQQALLIEIIHQQFYFNSGCDTARTRVCDSCSRQCCRPAAKHTFSSSNSAEATHRFAQSSITQPKLAGTTPPCVQHLRHTPSCSTTSTEPPAKPGEMLTNKGQQWTRAKRTIHCDTCENDQSACTQARVCCKRWAINQCCMRAADCHRALVTMDRVTMACWHKCREMVWYTGLTGTAATPHQPCLGALYTQPAYRSCTTAI
ncbi:hypothetical protein COO60DRAFT_555004 [Scenedesmus sp. NREL 46B-D3]|nr:hypothetical protein COO60DRAFT_555004 [Scenedesmus sp. NREL 46B-D3]